MDIFVKIANKSMESMNKKALLEYIRTNQLNDFFKTASALPQASENWKNELILLERRYLELEDQISDGVLSSEEASRQRNTISRDGMKLIEELDAVEPIHPAYPGVRKTKKSILLIAIGIGLLAALLVWKFSSSQDTNQPRRNKQETLLPSSDDAPPSTTAKTEEQAPPSTTAGTPLKVNGNNTKFESAIADFVRSVLEEKGIVTHYATNDGNYASAIDCRFSVDKNSRNSMLSVTLTLTARDADNTICFTRRFASEKQTITAENQEWIAIKGALKSLQEAIQSSGIKSCPN